MNGSVLHLRGTAEGATMGPAPLVLAAIATGSLLGRLAPNVGHDLGTWIDPLVLLLVTLVLFGTGFSRLTGLKGNLRFIAITWLANFLIIPVIGLAIASLFLSGHSLLLTGLIIYFMAPCTDWFLGFTRLANGNVALGAALIPLNMVTQLLLYPVYLYLFTAHQAVVDTTGVTSALGAWFVLPLLIAVVLNLVVHQAGIPSLVQRTRVLSDRLVPLVIALLVFVIFAANVTTLFDHADAVPRILGAVFLFFLLTYMVGEVLSWIGHFAYPEQVLLAMTTAARNAPLMLGVTMVALPNQPIIYAALIIGMLVEFPHLAVLTHILSRRHDPAGAFPSMRRRGAS